MINKVVGDTILFEVNLTDSSGSAITDATGSMTIVDGVGSTVLASNAAHTSAGTYQKSQSTAGWGRGPIVETWRFSNSAGTTTQVLTNTFRIVGTEAIRTYIFKDELPTYHEQIEDYYDGSEEASIVDAFNEVNSKLEALGHKMPILPNSDGFHDQALRDLNAYAALTRIISKRQTGFRVDDNGRPWFKYFDDQAGSIYRKIEKKGYSFARDFSPGEGGIGQATKAVGSAAGVLETNWRGGAGTGFTDSSYERSWHLRITGLGTAGMLNECTYVFSRDDEVTYEGTGTTSYGWSHLYDGLFVRFHRGTSVGSTGLFAVGEKWGWRTHPVNQTMGGKRSAQSY